MGLFLHARTLLILTAALALTRAPGHAQEKVEKEFQQESDEYVRDELGVNDITAPSIAQILKDFGAFQPFQLDLIAANPRDAVYDNRLQTSLHFGSLVADGFILTIAERPQDIQDVGRALIRQSHALGVGDRLTRRSKSLFEASDKGDWQGMREELIKTQADVEKSMLDLHDEQMAHMISLGGWLRGFEIGTVVTAENYSPQRAAGLMKTDVMDYFLDRLSTLNPRLRTTELVNALVSRLEAIRKIAGAGTLPVAISSQHIVKLTRRMRAWLKM